MKRWTNITAFYYRPKHEPGDGKPPKAAPAASLIVRGSEGTRSFATQFELRLADLKPSALHDCLLAAEDRRFYDHAGLDYFGVIKAGYDHIFKGLRFRGGSTITNQLMRTVILADQSRSLFRKIPEIVLTNVAERHFSKDDLLLSYVNNDHPICPKCLRHYADLIARTNDSCVARTRIALNGHNLATYSFTG